MAACGDEGDRRFATDDQPSFVAGSPTPAPTLTPPPTATPATPDASPGSLLAPAGGAPEFTFVFGGAVWSAAPAEDRVSRSLDPLPGEVLAADQHGPSGALAMVLGDTAGVSLVIVDAGGTVRTGTPDLAAVLDRLAPGARPVSIDWSAAADRLLLATVGGGVLEIPLAGDPAVLLAPTLVPFPVEARWDPSGAVVAVVAREEAGGPARLYVVKPRGGATDLVAVAPTGRDPGRSVVAVEWVEPGDTLVYLEGITGGGNGRDLFAVRPSGADRRLLATAGQIAPAAGVTAVLPSPGGASVAFTIHEPDAEGPGFNTLWVRSVGSETLVEIPLSAGERLASFGWTASGLVWQTELLTPEGASAGGARLYVMGGDLRPRLFAEILAPGATPVASPETVPGASPVASPPPPPPA
ncbi:MAG: hypothetical protein WKF80_08105 [Thermomicrobiales bacterium]